MDTHKRIKTYQKCSRKRKQWNEWLVFKVVASALWIIQGILSNFHASVLHWKAGISEKGHMGLNKMWDAVKLEFQKVSLIFSLLIQNKLFEVCQIDVPSKILLHKFLLLKVPFFF